MPVTFHFVGPEAFVAPYEDRPFRENLDSACREISIVPSPDSETAVLICCPEQGEQEEASVPVSPVWLRQCAEAADALIGRGRRVYLLDVLRANGGAPGLLSAIKKPDAL